MTPLRNLPQPDYTNVVGAGEVSRRGALGLLQDTTYDLWRRRDLVVHLVRRELGSGTTNTILGNVWWLLDPLLQLAIYVLLVGVIFQRATADYPLFVFAALLPWKWFSSSVMASLGSVVRRERIIRQVPFPKIVLPVASILAHTVHFGLGLAVLVAAMIAFYADRLSAALIWVPVIAAVQLLLTLAIGITFAAVNVFYRDLTNLMRHILRLGLYVSPVLYGVELAEETIGSNAFMMVYRLNPFVTLLEAYRSAIYLGTGPALGPLLALAAASLLLCLSALVIFRRTEPLFAKVL